MDSTSYRAVGRLGVLDLPEGILSSWNRCLRLGLDPRARPENAFVSAQDLRHARRAEEQLLKIVRPELEMLSSQIAGSNHVTAFANEAGMILDAIMDAEFEEAACARTVRPGSVWREDIRGTNALGMALVTGRTSMVTGGEHFFEAHAGVSCVCVPVHASDGRIVGLLDASSEIEARQAHTRALVELSARNIENRLFGEAHQRDHVLLFHPRAEYLATQGVGLIAFDDQGRVSGLNRCATGLLAGVELSMGRRFGDLFRGDFHDVLGRMSGQDTGRLSDRLGARLFARLRTARPRTTPQGVRRTVTLRAPTVERLTPQNRRFVLDDDLVRHSLRLACKAARLGQPVCIRGAAGTGKTALAEVIHRRIHPDRPMVSVDCRGAIGAIGAPGAHGITGEALLPGGTDGVGFEAGGTLLLEGIAALRGAVPTELDRLLERQRREMRAGRWILLATDRDAVGAEVVLGPMKLLAVDLPRLGARSDFGKLVRSMLAELSTDHRLSSGAMRVLAGAEWKANLHDLWHQLQVLVTRSPAGILREADLDGVLADRDAGEATCDRCQGTPIREQRCREIRRTFRACQGNVALAARRLGVSRNTVYAHIRD